MTPRTLIYKSFYYVISQIETHNSLGPKSCNFYPKTLPKIILIGQNKNIKVVNNFIKNY